MSVIRQDPTTRAWVIVATDRGQRPHDPDGARAPTPSEDEPARVDTCPSCPGNEATIAGFELGSGMFISTMLPEETAVFVRECETRRGPTPE
jgi:galactose-1-phosphate uridylyltransferase